MGKHRPDETREFPTLPEELETKRRVWPVAATASVAMALAVGIPIFLSGKQSATFVPTPTKIVSPSAGPTALEPTSVPVTVYRPIPQATKTIFRPTPVPTTIYRDRWHSPTSAPTVTRTIKAKPRPAVTITEEIITCIGVDRDGTIIGETECPS